jgi:hypothetical protein
VIGEELFIAALHHFGAQLARSSAQIADPPVVGLKQSQIDVALLEIPR